jgi:hypothetical protein
MAERYSDRVIIRDKTPMVIVFKLDAEMPTKGFLEFLAGLK